MKKNMKKNINKNIKYCKGCEIVLKNGKESKWYNKVSKEDKDYCRGCYEIKKNWKKLARKNCLICGKELEMSYWRFHLRGNFCQECSRRIYKKIVRKDKWAVDNFLDKKNECVKI